MTRVAPFFALALLLSACVAGSGVSGSFVTGAKETSSTEDFDLSVVQARAGAPFRGQTSTDVRFDLALRNRTDETWTVSRIALQGIGSTPYEIPITTREYERSVRPGVEETFEYWATAYVGSDDGTAPSRPPLAVRVKVEMQSAAGVKREETFTRRLHGTFQVGGTREST